MSDADWIREKVEEINERTIRLEERIVTLFKRLEDRPEVKALEARVDAVEALKRTLASRIWEIVVLIGGAFAAAWAAVKVGEHK